jgi:hypothetical protein
MGQAEARLYEVQTPRGIVYAVHQLGTGTFWTERAEAAARQAARDRGLMLVGEQTVSLDEFLRLTGRQPIPIEPPPKSPPAPSPANEQVRFTVTQPNAAASLPLDDPLPAAPTIQNRGATKDYTFAARYFLEGEAPPPRDDEIVVSRPEAPPPKGIFCSDKPLADAAPPDEEGAPPSSGT